ncbi:hypothetical protein SI859A1_00903 [Aurantimonas manganoxydans SI85-9A1]|uniref:Uncharacterized protein n=1 Tax=Aurantimonas manganoxydans (strain ATCC BAA-1229 / DSM 21871 / SI85-9A1) TaxID=287752 RepID=Q1YJU5_AURMS|nr:hypothetical protein [Aurantimonas manganoxydans]EAS50778.1 hypothetical protein SI859A1_00903 [Aurantimonas manganoxydans SI85-9A1]
MNKTEAFGSYGVKLKNVRWSWSAKATDDSLVVLTFWKDKLLFDKATKTYSYDDSAWEAADEVNRPGNSERREYIRLALAKLGGVVRVVVATAEDTKARPRKIASAHPLPRVLMKIVEFDDETGQFKAHSIPTPSQSAGG